MQATANGSQSEDNHGSYHQDPCTSTNSSTTTSSSSSNNDLQQHNGEMTNGDIKLGQKDYIKIKSKVDQDIIRLIGQHLRCLGLE